MRLPELDRPVCIGCSVAGVFNSRGLRMSLIHLTGETGASWISAAKGATEAMISSDVDRNLEHYADVISELCVSMSKMSRAGAAGGMEAAL